MDEKTKIGPVQLLAIGFNPDAKFEGKIIKELERLEKIKTIRLLDLLFIKKDRKTNNLLALSIQQEKLGAIIGALMGFDFEEDKKMAKRKSKDELDDSENNAFGLSTRQIQEIGESLEPGMAAAVVLIEHVWARDLKQAIRDTGGVPIAEGFLTPEAIAEVSAELTAMVNTMEKMEAEEHKHTRTRAYN